MTFRILNDEARGQIAAHIFGSAPPGHPRAGSVSGTDAPAKSYEPPPPKYGGTPEYDPTGGGGGGGSGGGGGGGGTMCLTDKRTGWARPVPPNHDGKCPPDSGTLTYRLLNAGTPEAACCPSSIQTGTQDNPGGVLPPTGLPPVYRCPSGTKDQMPPGLFQGHADFNRNKAICLKKGSWVESPVTAGFFHCCVPETPSEPSSGTGTGTGTPPSGTGGTPPSGTGTGTGKVTDDAYPTSWDGICSVATPLADIAAKSWGWARIKYAVTFGTADCTGVSGGAFSSASYSSDTSCSDISSGDASVFAYNPGGSTIARNTSVVVVREFTAESYMTRAIIVVVPCST